jgi:xylosylprotein 4-beta-galactosyltransferase
MLNIFLILILLLLFILNNKKSIENFVNNNYENIILIPYRNREKHIQYFIKNSIPLLDKYLNNYKVIVIEQKNNYKFNRGLLLNIGYDICKNYTTYIFTHDVDLNPYKKTIINMYNKPVKNNQIIGIYTSKYNTLGGIIKLKINTYKKMNGFSNTFWGWGLEDKDLQNRAETVNIKIKKYIKNNDKNKSDYFKIFNDINDRNITQNYDKRNKFIKNNFKFLSNKDKKKNIFSSGVNNLKYNIINKKYLHPKVIFYQINFNKNDY